MTKVTDVEVGGSFTILGDTYDVIKIIPIPEDDEIVFIMRPRTALGASKGDVITEVHAYKADAELRMALYTPPRPTRVEVDSISAKAKVILTRHEAGVSLVVANPYHVGHLGVTVDPGELIDALETLGYTEDE